MGSSCLNFSRAVAAKKLQSFTLNKSDHAHGHRNILLSPFRQKNSASVACCCASENYGALPSDMNIHEDFGKMELVQCKQRGADRGRGIGIIRFLGGKNFFITGATGFLAKVLIEKILRTNPDVGKIYVLIKAKDNEAAMKRLKAEVIDTELFRCLQEIHGENYQAFMSRKLVPVVGDVREANMGIEAELAEEIAEEADIVINSAATTTFDERYDVALDINTIGPCRLMSFARRFKRLKLFLQVSTAYVNGQRQGRIQEKPFCLGDTISRETSSSKFSAHKNTVLDIEAEIKLAFDSRRNGDASVAQEVKELGLERAKLYGWQDTYVFTKAMGEMVINCMRGEIPVVTVRPSVIESTFREPFPGWMEGNRMMDPVILYYGKGQLTGFVADPNGVLDVVPADMVVNATLAAMAKHGLQRAPGMHIYHVASSTMNPLVFKDLNKLIFEHFSSTPCIDAMGRPVHVPPMKLFTDMDEFSDYLSTDAVQRSRRPGAAGVHEKLTRRLQELRMKSVEQAMYLASIYEPYTFYRGRFDNTNTHNLIDEMSEEEKASFHFDVRSIDWGDYIRNVHIPGLRKHVMKGRGIRSKPSLVGATV